MGSHTTQRPIHHHHSSTAQPAQETLSLQLDCDSSLFHRLWCLLSTALQREVIFLKRTLYTLSLSRRLLPNPHRTSFLPFSPQPSCVHDTPSSLFIFIFSSSPHLPPPTEPPAPSRQGTPPHSPRSPPTCR